MRRLQDRAETGHPRLAVRELDIGILHQLVKQALPGQLRKGALPGLLVKEALPSQLMKEVLPS